MQLPPVFVSGRVMLEDGTAPTESVAIERVCASGSPHTEGYTDGKGYFSIELGQKNLTFCRTRPRISPATSAPSAVRRLLRWADSRLKPMAAREPTPGS